AVARPGERPPADARRGRDAALPAPADRPGGGRPHRRRRAARVDVRAGPGVLEAARRAVRAVAGAEPVRRRVPCREAAGRAALPPPEPRARGPEAGGAADAAVRVER